MLLSVNCYSQNHIEKSIQSDAAQVILEFNVIDQIELLNSEDDTILILADGRNHFPIFNLKEVNHIVYVEEIETPLVQEESDGLDKVCIVEPNFVSYQVYVPKGRDVYISFMEGNFYADYFKGDLNLIVEDGIIKLDHINGSVKTRLNTGSIFAQNIENAYVDAETSMGTLITDTPIEGFIEGELHLKEIIGAESKKLLIKTIMANIYLNIADN